MVVVNTNKIIESLNIREFVLRQNIVFVIDTRPLYSELKISKYNRDDFGRYKTRKEAVAAMNNLIAAYNGNEEIEVKKQKLKIFTVSQAILEYLQEQKLLMKPKYYDEQIQTLNILEQVIFDGIAIGLHKLERLGREDQRGKVRALLEYTIKNEGQSNETMYRRRKHWGKFFKTAAGKGWMQANPIADLKLPKKTKRSIQAPKVQEGFTEWLQTDGLQAYEIAYKQAAEKILANGRKKYKKKRSLPHSPFKVQVMMLLSICSGLRVGELRALKRWDYSANRQMITVRGAVEHGTQNIGRVKTDEGQDREIELPPFICRLLNEHLLQSKFKQPDDLIFPNNVGNPIRSNDFSELCQPIRAACPFVDEKTGKTIHFEWKDLRHIFASNMINQLGPNWPEVAEVMGHTNAGFTKDKYGHYIENKEKSDRRRNASAAIIVPSAAIFAQ